MQLVTLIPSIEGTGAADWAVQARLINCVVALRFEAIKGSPLEKPLDADADAQRKGKSDVCAQPSSSHLAQPVAHRDLTMTRTVFTFGDSKSAALYFDHVVPLFPVLDRHVDFFLDFQQTYKNVDQVGARYGTLTRFLDGLLPDQIRTSEEAMLKLSAIRTDIESRICLDGEPVGEYLADAAAIVEALNPGQITISRIGQSAVEALEDIWISGAAVTANQCFISDYLPGPADDVAVSLMSIPLIDVSKIHLDHVLDFRQDKDARRKLRRLRLFAEERYVGRSREFVEDDIEQRIADYNDVVKKWAFETRYAVLSALLNSKTLALAGAGGLAAALLGQPLASLGSLAGGVVVEAGKLTLEISRKRFEAREALKNHPISYITDARRALNPAGSSGSSQDQSTRRPL